MFRALYYNHADKAVETGNEDLITARQPGKKDWLWIDLYNADPAEEERVLRTYYQLNELAVTDALRERHPPKFEAFDDYLFVLLRGLSTESRDLDHKTIQIACFAGRSFLITRHKAESLSINRAWENAAAGKFNLERGPVHLLYRIARYVVDRYTPILLELETRLESIEEELFARPDDRLLSELVGYNTRLKTLRRTLSYQTNVFATLKHYPSELLNTASRHEFNDVFEQFERLNSLAQLHQELTTDLINGYLSLNAHRLNQIMKVLTIVAVIFLPLGLLAGIYGMNFEFIPELHWRYGYFIVLGTMLTIGATIIIIMRRVKWL